MTVDIKKQVVAAIPCGARQLLSSEKNRGGITYRAEIDGLRAIAVCGVIAFHAFPGYFPGGFVGVDVFFVISGFLISGIILNELEKDTFSIWNFYARRIRRIFPALLIILVACFLLGWRLLSFEEYKQLGRHLAAASGFVINFQLLKEADYFDTEAAVKPLLHLWSLAVEEQFYLVWPSLLIFAGWFRRIGALIILVLIFSFAANVVIVQKHEVAAFYLPVTRFWELMLGAGLAFAQMRKQSFLETAANTKAFLGLALVVSSFLLISEDRLFPGFWALMPTVGTALMISSSRQAWLNRAILGSRPFVFVGLISYPLYLWHWPILSFARIAARGENIAASTILFLIALAFVLAAATYVFIERPIQRLSWPEFRNRWAPGLLASVICIGVMGATIPKSKLALSRFPVEVRKLLTLKTSGMGKGKGCFLRPNEGPSHFIAGCVDPASTDAKPLLLLWGDSHAAHLVPGLRKLQNESSSFRLARFTAAGCPAVIAGKALHNQGCAETNEFVMKRIVELKPDIVVMAGFWYHYGIRKNKKKQFWKLDSSALANTVRLIRNAGVKQVVFVGEVPVWKIFQPIISAELLVSTGQVPEQTKLYLDPVSLSVDRMLQSKITSAGALYLTPSEYLCTPAGCRIEFAGEPVYFDKDHLTSTGSLLLVRPILRALKLP